MSVTFVNPESDPPTRDASPPVVLVVDDVPAATEFRNLEQFEQVYLGKTPTDRPAARAMGPGMKAVGVLAQLP